ncbi:MAG: type II toxin-antitoxin system VapC family toxin [Devosia sp.]
MSLVVDASIVGAWLLPDERSPEAVGIARLIDETETWVPQLFPIEIGNALLAAERRKRASPAYVAEQLASLERMPLRLDTETNAEIWGGTYRLAKDEGLTVYDATYLELALRLGAQLATLDRDLANAARRRGLTVLP